MTKQITLRDAKLVYDDSDGNYHNTAEEAVGKDIVETCKALLEFPFHFGQNFALVVKRMQNLTIEYELSRKVKKNDIDAQSASEIG